MITSNNNSQIKNLIQLQKKSKERKTQGVFVAEGIKMFQEAKQEGSIIKVYISETFNRQSCKEVINESSLEEYEIEIISDKLMNEVSETVSPQGILAIVKQCNYNLNEMLKDKFANILILESLNDPGNLGTILRTGEGAGISGIIMNKTTVDIYNPKVIRSTMGSIFRVPFIYVDDLEDTLELVKKNNIMIYAAHLNGKRFYDEFNYIKKCAFLIGNEANGLSEAIGLKADNYVKLPMKGRVESLNAAVSASILMYEVDRQRRKQ